MLKLRSSKTFILAQLQNTLFYWFYFQTSDYQQPQSSSAQDQLTPVPDQHHSFPSSHFPTQPASSHSSLQHHNPVQHEGPVPHQLQSYTVQQLHTPLGATAQTGVPSPGMAPQAEPPAEIVSSQGMVPQGVHVSSEPAQWQGSMQGANQQVHGAGPSVSGHSAQGDITIPSVPLQLSSLLDIGPVFPGQGGDQFHPARGDVKAHQGVAPVEDTSFHTMPSQGTTLRDVALAQRVQQSGQFQPLEGRTASPIHQQQRGALQHTQMDHGVSTQAIPPQSAATFCMQGATVQSQQGTSVQGASVTRSVQQLTLEQLQTLGISMPPSRPPAQDTDLTTPKQHHYSAEQVAQPPLRPATAPQAAYSHGDAAFSPQGASQQEGVQQQVQLAQPYGTPANRQSYPGTNQQSFPATAANQHSFQGSRGVHPSASDSALYNPPPMQQPQQQQHSYGYGQMAGEKLKLLILYTDLTT